MRRFFAHFFTHDLHLNTLKADSSFQAYVTARQQLQTNFTNPKNHQTCMVVSLGIYKRVL
jgi:hypothetical protein